MSTRNSIIDSLTSVVEKTLDRQDVPVSSHNVGQVTDKVVAAVAPVMVNATNNEPWYKSRIYWGLIAAGAGIVTSRFGFVLSGEDLQTLLDSGSDLITTVGLLYALYGRVVGAKKPPLGG